MFRAVAAEVWWVLISTLSFQVFWGHYFVSQAFNLLFGCVFLHATWVGLCLGVLNPVFQLQRVGKWPFSLYLIFRCKFELWGGWISMHFTNSMHLWKNVSIGVCISWKKCCNDQSTFAICGCVLITSSLLFESWNHASIQRYSFKNLMYCFQFASENF